MSDVTLTSPAYPHYGWCTITIKQIQELQNAVHCADAPLRRVCSRVSFLQAKSNTKLGQYSKSSHWGCVRTSRHFSAHEANRAQQLEPAFDHHLLWVRYAFFKPSYIDRHDSKQTCYRTVLSSYHFHILISLKTYSYHIEYSKSMTVCGAARLKPLFSIISGSIYKRGYIWSSPTPAAASTI